MGSISKFESKPHAVCVPFPMQGHVSPMLKLAKLLHHSGFFVTFVNTEYNHRRLIRSRGAAAVAGLPDFRFETIPDGLPLSDANVSQDPPALCVSTTTTCLEPFCQLIERLNGSGAGAPPVSCIVSDGVMSFTLKAAERFELPEVLFWTTSACGLLAYAHVEDLVGRGYIFLYKDGSSSHTMSLIRKHNIEEGGIMYMSQVRSGYLETRMDWMAGMKNMRLRDFPSFIRTTNGEDTMLRFLMQEAAAIPRAKALILNTFDAMESDVIAALAAKFPSQKVYTVGPLQLMLDHVDDDSLKPFTSNLSKEDPKCIDWLDTMAPGSVVYVNFGSIAVMTIDQMEEFTWGLANSKKPFLWIIRPDAVAGEAAIVPPEFVEETRDRCMMVSWCPQEQVLNHPAIGVFLTHCGWNSTLESVAGGVPLICWPFFAEQLTNCRYSCLEWGIGMEIDNDVKRDEVEILVREMMEGEKGKETKRRAMEWKRKAEEAAVSPAGSSFLNLHKLITMNS